MVVGDEKYAGKLKTSSNKFFLNYEAINLYQHTLINNSTVDEFKKVLSSKKIIL